MINRRAFKFDMGWWSSFFKINKIVRRFVLADLFFFSGWGLIGPVLPIFIIEKISGATIVNVGTAIGIYWLVRAAIQLPVAIWLDKIVKVSGERKDYYVLVLGLIMASVTALSFIFVSNIEQLYFVQILQAISFGLYVPSWAGIFNRHLDGDRVAFDVSLDNTTLAFAYGVTAISSGIVAEIFGFQAIFIAASVLSMIAAIIILITPDVVFRKWPVKKMISEGNSRIKKSIE